MEYARSVVEMFRKLSKRSAVIVSMAALMVLFGWMTDNEFLKSVSPAFVSMKVNTALGFLFASVALLFFSSTSSHRRNFYFGCISSLIVAGIGAATLAQYIGNSNVGIDQLFIVEPAGTIGTTFPGRMAINTAVNFLLIGIALVLLRHRNNSWVFVSHGLILVAMIIALFGMFGYLYGMRIFFTDEISTRMAIHTSLLFLVLTSGMLFSRPTAGIMSKLSGEDESGVMIRFVLPFIILMPILIEAIAKIGFDIGLYSARIGELIHLMGVIVLLSIIAWRAAGRIKLAESRRREADIQLGENKRTMQALLANLPGIAYRCVNDSKWTMEYLSDGCASVTGYEVTELLWNSKISYADIIHPEDSVKVWNTVQAAVSRKEHFEMEYRILHKDGTIRWVGEKGSGVYDAEGTLVALEGFINDINESKIDKEELEQFFSVSLELLCIADTEGYFKKLNPRWTELLGYSNEELMEQPFISFVHPEDVESTMEEVKKLSSGSSIIEFVNRYRTKDGAYKWISWATIPVNGMLYAAARDITAIKHAEVLYQSVIQTSYDGFWIVDYSTGRLLDVNNSYCLLTGYSRSEVLSMTVSDFDALESADDVAERIAKVIQHGNDRFQTVHKHKNGRRIDVDVTASWRSETKEKIYVFIRDMSEQKSKSAALKESEQRLAISLDAGQLGAWDLDVINDTSVRSLKHDQIFGYNEPIAEWGSKKFMEHVVPQDREYVQGKFAEAMVSGTLEFETRIVTKDMRERWIAVQGIVIKAENGKSVRMMGVVRDISEMKNNLEALRKSELRYRTLLEFLPLPIAVVNNDGVLTYINNRFTTTLGYTLSDIPTIDLWWEKAYPDEAYREHVVESWGRTVETAKREQKDVELTEYEVTCKNGDIKTIMIAGIFLNDGIVATFTDYTERKKFETRLKMAFEKLKQSNNQLEQFAYVASHDLQEPLRMISSYTQLLERRYKDKLDSDANEFIGYAVDGANRMQMLINDLLEYSRVSTRGKPLVKTNLANVLGIAIANLKNKIEENNAVIYHDELPECWVDEIQLSRLFQNLIDNSIKFKSSSLPAIHISSREEESMFVISVKDNGIGIEQKYADRIFNIFQRLHTKTEYPGTGIGLAVCKRTIERHGGSIWCEPHPEGGTVFSFTLPKDKTDD